MLQQNIFRALVMVFYCVDTLLFPLSQFKGKSRVEKKYTLIKKESKQKYTYKSHLYYALGSKYIKQHSMFSECEFEEYNSIVFKQLGLSTSLLSQQCGHVYVRYRLLASGFFQLSQSPNLHISHNRIKYSEYSLYSHLFQL